MTSHSQRPTAKIYAFPAGGRPPPSRQREAGKTTNVPPRPAAAAERAPKMSFGSAWYHQAAVDEAEASCKR